MKKLLIFLILTVLFVGCASQKEAVRFTKPSTEPEQGAVSLTMQALTQDAYITLTAKWSNFTQEEYTYGEAFCLQYLDQGKWIDVPMRQNWGFHMLAYLLKPGTEAEITYHITPTFLVTRAGQYRICAEAIDTQDRPMMLYLPFSLNEPQTQELEYRAKILRTDGYVEGAVYPQTTVITEKEQLDHYLAENKDTFGFTSDHTDNGMGTASFTDLCERYTDAYFTERYLILTVLEAPSGSVRHFVENVTQHAGEICVNIGVIEPFCGTSDMAQWHVVIELEKGEYLPAVTVSTESQSNWVYNDMAGDCVYTAMPNLYLQGSGVFYPTVKGACSWGYTLDRQQWNHINACGSHPFSVEKLPMPLYFDDNSAYLYFEDTQYDSLKVTALPIDQWGKTTQGQTLEVENGAFQLLPGENLYWVSAQWEQADNCLYYGGGDYLFYAIAP